ncbi:S-layer homology domain-containing protein [Salsuginibacillus kocurii]|uniref:S-layer homology domain-containing protein n=1 Tax=Salsuginibacillus kocurii TaxID=427078 RepID=UPI00037E8DF0|nr:S-layer homology domain-containing protein [Salsuginibacillus kocurii]
MLFRTLTAAEALDLSDDDIEIDTSELGNFTDAGEIGPWAEEALAYLVSEGVLEGHTNGSLAPRDSTTRAEMASMLDEYLQYIDFSN